MLKRCNSLEILDAMKQDRDDLDQLCTNSVYSPGEMVTSELNEATPNNILVIHT